MRYIHNNYYAWLFIQICIHTYTWMIKYQGSSLTPTLKTRNSAISPSNFETRSKGGGEIKFWSKWGLHVSLMLFYIHLHVIAELTACKSCIIFSMQDHIENALHTCPNGCDLKIKLSEVCIQEHAQVVANSSMSKKSYACMHGQCYCFVPLISQAYTSTPSMHRDFLSKCRMYIRHWL